MNEATETEEMKSVEIQMAALARAFNSEVVYEGGFTRREFLLGYGGPAVDTTTLRVLLDRGLMERVGTASYRITDTGRQFLETETDS